MFPDEPSVLTQDTPVTLLEANQCLSKSLLWQLERTFFDQQGIRAWNSGAVPHYITSNPTIATAYAKLSFALWQDQTHLISPQPLTLCELGAGSGRFAFHFLTHLTHLCQQHNLPLTHFRYILTDFAQANLDHWQQHPHFQPFFQQGILDTARFDINHDHHLTLQNNRQTLTPQSLQRPLIVIANYFFDSIPQDLYYIHNGQIQDCLVSLSCAQDPNILSPAQLLDHLQLHYHYQPTTLNTLHPQIQSLLRHYQHRLTDTHLLVPTIGLLGLNRLQALSQQGLLLLSADKGPFDLGTLQGNRPPQLVTHHGCFSFSVNYPLFKTFCEQQGGIALTPVTAPQSLYVIALIMGNHPERYRQTQRAYQRHIQTSGPDNFFRITQHVRQILDQMSVANILAYLRLSHYDSHQFIRCLPRLQQLAPSFTPQEQTAVLTTMDEIWQRYFPIGENNDLAFDIASLCFRLKDYDRALQYFKHSNQLYGEHPDTLTNMAICHQHLGQLAQANSLLQLVLKYNPEHIRAQALLSKNES
ncbi:MAG: SAM-dependent methyltransferase [Elainellaceae cyanobacterium]